MTTTSPYRFGGWSGIVVAVASLLVTLLVLLIGAPPTDTEELLRYLRPATTTWSIITGVSVIADLLVLPLAYALYRALRDVGGNLALAGCGLLVVFAILDLAVRWPSYAALIALADASVNATTTEFEALTAAAGQASGLLRSFLLPIYVTVIPGIGILLASVAWYRAHLGGLLAYVGMAVGLLAFVTILVATLGLTLDVLMIVTSAASALWFAAAGYALLKLEST